VDQNNQILNRLSDLANEFQGIPLFFECREMGDMKHHMQFIIHSQTESKRRETVIGINTTKSDAPGTSKLLKSPSTFQ
jgi:hypothetical protein